MFAEVISSIAAMGQKQQPFRFRPSNAGPEKCLRSLVYESLGFPHKALPGRAMLIFDDSSWHEELTLNWLRKSLYKIHSEQMGVECFTFADGYALTGSIDCIATDIDGNDRLIEHKAINHFTFTQIEAGDLIPLDNITQTILYHCGLIALSKELKHPILLIKNKNTSRYLEFELVYCIQVDTAVCIPRTLETNEDGIVKAIEAPAFKVENILGRVKERYNLLKSATENKTIPDRQYSLDSWRCDYCSYNGVCYDNYDEEFLARKEGFDFETNPELSIMIKAYKNLTSEISEREKPKEQIKKNIKEFLAKEQIKSGYCGNLSITLDRREVVEKLHKGYISEVLNIKEMKVK